MATLDQDASPQQGVAGLTAHLVLASSSDVTCVSDPQDDAENANLPSKSTDIRKEVSTTLKALLAQEESGDTVSSKRSASPLEEESDTAPSTKRLKQAPEHQDVSEIAAETTAERDLSDREVLLLSLSNESDKLVAENLRLRTLAESYKTLHEQQARQMRLLHLEHTKNVYQLERQVSIAVKEAAEMRVNSGIDKVNVDLSLAQVDAKEAREECVGFRKKVVKLEMELKTAKEQLLKMKKECKEKAVLESDYKRMYQKAAKLERICNAYRAKFLKDHESQFRSSSSRHRKDEFVVETQPSPLNRQVIAFTKPSPRARLRGSQKDTGSPRPTMFRHAFEIPCEFLPMKAPKVIKCVPLRPPIPQCFRGDMEKFQNAELPPFEDILNYRDADVKNFSRRQLPEDKRYCIMCGQARSFNLPRRRQQHSMANPAGPKEVSIPSQNRGLCNLCDIQVWTLTEANVPIKWCKGCRNFHHWAAFGIKGSATKCVRIRDQLASKYQEKRATAGINKAHRNRSNMDYETLVTAKELVVNGGSDKEEEAKEQEQGGGLNGLMAVAEAATVAQQKFEDASEHEAAEQQDNVKKDSNEDVAMVGHD